MCINLKGIPSWLPSASGGFKYATGIDLIDPLNLIKDKKVKQALRFASPDAMSGVSEMIVDQEKKDKKKKQKNSEAWQRYYAAQNQTTGRSSQLVSQDYTLDQNKNIRGGF